MHSLCSTLARRAIQPLVCLGIFFKYAISRTCAQIFWYNSLWDLGICKNTFRDSPLQPGPWSSAFSHDKLQQLLYVDWPRTLTPGSAVSTEHETHVWKCKLKDASLGPITSAELSAATNLPGGSTAPLIQDLLLRVGPGQAALPGSWLEMWNHRL